MLVFKVQLSKRQNHKADWAIFCGLLRKAELFHWHLGKFRSRLLREITQVWNHHNIFSKIDTACLSSAFPFIRQILVVGFWERFLKSQTIIIYPHDGWLSATYKTIEQVMLCITPSDLSRHNGMFWQDFRLVRGRSSPWMQWNWKLFYNECNI